MFPPKVRTPRLPYAQNSVTSMDKPAILRSMKGAGRRLRSIGNAHGNDVSSKIEVTWQGHVAYIINVRS